MIQSRLHQSHDSKTKYFILTLTIFLATVLCPGLNSFAQDSKQDTKQNTKQETKQETKKDTSITHKLGKEKITLVPDKMLRAYDPITVFFPSRRGPEKGGPLDQPGDMMRITPHHPGQYRWVDGRTLQFLPTTALACAARL